MTTIIQPVANPGSNSRRAARIRRLMRLRTTARLLTLVLTVMPMRVGDRPNGSAVFLSTALPSTAFLSDLSESGKPGFLWWTGTWRSARSVKLRVLRRTPDW